MCDTAVLTPSATADRSMLFGKNSDRQRNEAQYLEYISSGLHAPDASVACTYLTIPQVARTRAVLLSRPFWMWGAEMGANDCGVTIGNEGIHARAPASDKMALTGMDLLRLALERADSAAEAVEVITSLLEQFGQGGNCGHITPNFYNNGFLVADASEAFVLETVGKEWLVERVGQFRTLSNAYSIRADAGGKSPGLDRLITESGWSRAPICDYAAAIGNPNREHIGNAQARCARSTLLMSDVAGSARASVLDLIVVLRDHGGAAGSVHSWNPEFSSHYTLCMHAGSGDRPGQTVSSWVSELTRGGDVHWVTGTAAPCISIFKPVFLDSPPTTFGPTPADQFDPRTLWWRHERLHRRALLNDLPAFIESIRHERDELEEDFARLVRALLNGGKQADRTEVTARCWKAALELEERWFQRLHKTRPARDSPYSQAWIQMNRMAGSDGLL